MKTDKTPATKADIQMVVEAITGLERQVKAGHQQLRRDIGIVVDTLSAIDDRLTSRVNSHEQRIRRLEEQVGVAV